MSIRSVIADFGGIRPMAEKLGHRHHTTVQGWWDRNVIPAQRQREVLDRAAALKLSLNADDLVPDMQGVVVKEARSATCTACGISPNHLTATSCHHINCPIKEEAFEADMQARGILTKEAA